MLTARTVWLEPGDPPSLAELRRSTGWTDLVVKPAVSATAWRLHRLRPDQQTWPPELATAMAADAFLVQPFLTEIGDGEWSLVFFDGGFSHAVLKRPRPGEFRVQEEYGGHATAEVASPALIEQAQRILDLLPERPLYARVDGVRDRVGLPAARARTAGAGALLRRRQLRRQIASRTRLRLACSRRAKDLQPQTDTDFTDSLGARSLSFARRRGEAALQRRAARRDEPDTRDLPWLISACRSPLKSGRSRPNRRAHCRGFHPARSAFLPCVLVCVSLCKSVANLGLRLSVARICHDPQREVSLPALPRERVDRGRDRGIRRRARGPARGGAACRPGAPGQ